MKILFILIQFISLAILLGAGSASIVGQMNLSVVLVPAFVLFCASAIYNKKYPSKAVVGKPLSKAQFTIVN